MPGSRKYHFATSSLYPATLSNGRSWVATVLGLDAVSVVPFAGASDVKVCNEWNCQRNLSTATKPRISRNIQKQLKWEIRKSKVLEKLFLPNGLDHEANIMKVTLKKRWHAMRPP